MIDIEVRIENIYEDPLDDSPDAMTARFEKDEAVKSVEVEVPKPNIACVTLELSVPDIPGFFANDETWDEWAEDMILPFTGIGKQEGDTGYFAEITEAPEEYEHAIGRSFEWGV